MEHSVNLVISDEEKERVWPWLDKVRERDTQTTQDMTADEQIAYYQVELKRLRKEQNFHPLPSHVETSHQWLLSIAEN